MDRPVPVESGRLPGSNEREWKQDAAAEAVGCVAGSTWRKDVPPKGGADSRAMGFARGPAAPARDPAGNPESARLAEKDVSKSLVPIRPLGETAAGTLERYRGVVSRMGPSPGMEGAGCPASAVTVTTLALRATRGSRRA